jgi:outer membrane lipoprotein SlyB
MNKLVLAAAAFATAITPIAAAPAFAKNGKSAYAAGYRDGQRSRAAYGCRRDSNAEGTVLGAVAGGVAGNALAKPGQKTLTTVVGAGLGGLVGREIDRSEKRCR